MHLANWWHLFTILLLSTGVASAQTNWPDFMSKLDPGLSASPVAAVVPASVTVEPPAPDVPPDKARWSGKWAGWACQDQVCDTKLIVEKVTAESATIIYAFASANVKPFTAHLEAKFVGDELQATLRSGAKLAYRMRREGDVEFLWRREAQWAAGILSKEK